MSVYCQYLYIFGLKKKNNILLCLHFHDGKIVDGKRPRGGGGGSNVTNYSVLTKNRHFGVAISDNIRDNHIIILYYTKLQPLSRLKWSHRHVLYY